MEGVTLDMERFRQGDSLIFKTVFDGLYHSLCLFTNRFLNNLDAFRRYCAGSLCALWNHGRNGTKLYTLNLSFYSSDPQYLS